MKALFIGGTGTISANITARAIALGWEVTLLNRGMREDRVVPGAKVIVGDVNMDESAIASRLSGLDFDVVVDFIAFVPGQLERDVRLFRDIARQFIFISSASAYQKPLNWHVVSEATPLANPFWEYSRNKIACEEYLMAEYRSSQFPCTIVRPSHTYDDRYLPVAVHGKRGAWQVIDRILRDKPVVVHGDGSSLWTLTHSEDFARGFCALMGNPVAIGETFQITNDESLCWNQVYDRIGEALGKKVIKYHVTSDFLASCDPDYAGTLLGDKAHSVVFDNSKIKRIAPELVTGIPFAEGARRCVRYLLSNPAAQTADPDFETFCDKVIAAQEGAKKAFFAGITR
jgi:nucleoside-diphosphate-sugar epimerase